VPLIVGITESCKTIATASFISLLSVITSTIEPFTLGTQSINFNFLSPFVTFLVYKAAAIVTERLLMNIDPDEGLKKLRILRGFLNIVGERWLSCSELSKTFKMGQADRICVERYLELLNENTTPRILKAVEHMR
jgi:hypothetical protein